MTTDKTTGSQLVLIQALAGAVGAVAFFYLIGGIVLGIRFNEADVPVDLALSVTPRAYLVVLGVQKVILPAIVVGAIAALLNPKCKRRPSGHPTAQEQVRREGAPPPAGDATVALSEDVKEGTPDEDVPRRPHYRTAIEWMMFGLVVLLLAALLPFKLDGLVLLATFAVLAGGYLGLLAWSRHRNESISRVAVATVAVLLAGLGAFASEWALPSYLPHADLQLADGSTVTGDLIGTINGDVFLAVDVRPAAEAAASAGSPKVLSSGVLKRRRRILILQRSAVTKISVAEEHRPNISSLWRRWRTTREDRAELYIRDVNSGDEKRLTTDVSYDGEPKWSVEGRIAFDSKRNGNSDVYLTTKDGDVTRLTSSQAYDGSPEWSPDGQQIVFESMRDGHLQLYTMRPDGSGQARMSNSEGDDGSPSWSSTGRILFTRTTAARSDVYVRNPDGSEGQLTLPSGDDSGSFNGQPVWSPDGEQIAFVSDRDGVARIYIMNQDGSAVHRLNKDWNMREWSPSWANDGQGDRIAFEAGRHIFDEDSGGPRAKVFVVRIDGQGRTALTSGNSYDEQPVWSKDGKELAFRRSFDRSALWFLTLEGPG